MFFWNGRLYHTLSADPRLYYRWFTPQSGTLGADTFVASGTTDGRNWSAVNGMTMASGRLLYATTTGTLSSVDFPNGLPPPPPPRSAAPPSTAAPGSPAPCSSSTCPDGVPVSCPPPRPCSSRDRAAVS
jgi:hypothetical protein